MQSFVENVDLSAPTSFGRQCVVFQLGREEYGVDISDVQEIIKFIPVTRVPNSLDFVTGVINLRGSIIPVIDLRRRLGLPGAVPSRQTCIVIVGLAGADGQLGLTVDRVSDVEEFADGELENPPQSMQHSPLDAVERIGKREDSMVMLLDVKKLFPMETFTVGRLASV